MVDTPMNKRLLGRLFEGKSHVVRRHFRRINGNVGVVIILATRLQTATRMLDRTYKGTTND
jgi:hypothetical protein